jgi:hypothetical protein
VLAYGRRSLSWCLTQPSCRSARPTRGSLVGKARAGANPCRLLRRPAGRAYPVSRWIALNQALIVDYWDGWLEIDEVLQRLQRLL